MRELELMGTLGCHLCEVAVGVLVQVVDPEKFIVYQVDIADEEQLMDKYATRIPVLVDVETQAEIGWPFDEQSLSGFLTSLKTEA